MIKYSAKLVSILSCLNKVIHKKIYMFLRERLLNDLLL